jgi:hypothetical protein
MHRQFVLTLTLYLFQAHIGVFHIALDLFQSSNGLDFLGLVIFMFQKTLPDTPVGIERFVLECLR